MRIDRRLVLIGVMLVVLSMTMATQYATTKVGYTYSIVHPSDSDIRFIGSDNSSDEIRVLRVDGANTSSDTDLKLTFGNVSADENKTYTAAFGIVNEERFAVNITHINVSVDDGAEADYLIIYLHADRDACCGDDATSVQVWKKGSVGRDHTACSWQLGPGNQNPKNMNETNLATNWDEEAHVRYSNSNVDAINQSSDFVWVQVSIDVPPDANIDSTYAGTIWVHTAATTYT